MRNVLEAGLAAVAAIALVACGAGGGGAGPNAAASPTPLITFPPNPQCKAIAPAPTSAGSLPSAAGLQVPAGFTISVLANVPGARELAALPNGDLLVGTVGGNTDIVPAAQTATAQVSPVTFVSIGDGPDNGVAFSQTQCRIFVATEHGIYAIPYATGQQHAAGAVRIAAVRTGPIAPNNDGDVHHTTSVAYSDVAQTLYAGVGSSCNACVEVDPTRATIQQMTANGGSMKTRATRFRNAIALAANPSSGHLWAGGAGQDSLPSLHPYEFLDDLTSHAGTADYGWPDCEENHVAYRSGADCANTVAPLIVLPAYTTLIGVTFYPRGATGKYAFPAAYAGGMFVTRHGSWHTPNGCTLAPEVDFVSMQGDRPAVAVNWSNPTTQWKPFITGFQPGCSQSTRTGRPTGVAVGTDGSLFVGDDQTGNIYRIRP
jgi:glucose/arabinose dehydrogenase